VRWQRVGFPKRHNVARTITDTTGNFCEVAEAKTLLLSGFFKSPILIDFDDQDESVVMGFDLFPAHPYAWYHVCSAAYELRGFAENSVFMNNIERIKTTAQFITDFDKPWKSQPLMTQHQQTCHLRTRCSSQSMAKLKSTFSFD
jgi:hypothetical protein